MEKKAKGHIKNLKPFTKENAKEFGSRGGKKSQRLEKERRKAKECMNMILKMSATGKNGKELMRKMGIEEADQQNIMLLMASMFAKGSSTGDPSVIKAILEIAGDLENQTEQNSPTININVSAAKEEDIEDVDN